MPLLKEYNPEKRSLCSPLKPSSSRIQIGNKPQAKPVSTLQQNDARATRRRFGFRIVYANVSENEYVVVGCPSSPPPPAPPPRPGPPPSPRPVRPNPTPIIIKICRLISNRVDIVPYVLISVAFAVVYKCAWRSPS